MKRQIFLLGYLAIGFITFPLIRSNMDRLAPVVHAAGERLALLAVFSELPDRSAALLERRFRGAVIQENETEAVPESGTERSYPKDSFTSDLEREQPPVLPDEIISEAESPELTDPDSEQEKEMPPEIPVQYQGPMLEEDLSGHNSSNHMKLASAGYLRNDTDLSLAEIEKIIQSPSSVSVGDASQPQVLIYHTHATEAFERYDTDVYDTRNNWRSTDNNMNMVAVGNALKKSLEENGVYVLHDVTQHDYPSYNGAYERSAETIAAYLEKYPNIQVLLDVHRDAIDRNGTLVRPVTMINGKKAAQLMIISPCDDGTMNIPEWRENLRFAASIQSQTETDFPGLMRPIFFCYRKYNLDKSPLSLLLEFGSHGNTLEECKYTASLVGKSIAQVIHAMEK